MAYKDKDKQREAQREWVRQKRKGSTDKGSTSQGSTGITRLVAPNTSDTVILKDESHVDASDVGAVKTLHQAINKPKQGVVWESEPGAATKIAEIVSGKPNVTGVCCVDHTCNFTGKMTVMERLFYRPANKLGRGDTNFVSLPGRACYGVV